MISSDDVSEEELENETPSISEAPAEFVENPPDDLICQICCYVLREPHVTDCCGQHLCKSCLDSSVNLFTSIKACPYCRENNFKHLIYKPYQRKINELMVYCKNKSQGCSDILKFKDLEQHVAKANKAGCLYTTLECPSGCYTELLRKDMDEHLKEACPNRYVTCEHCDEEMMWRDLEDHYDGCGKYPVLCPRSCADGMFIREQLAEHEKQCPNMVVECPFQEAGCSDEITRAQLTNHLESNMADHLGKLMTAYSQLKSEFQSLKSDHERKSDDIVSSSASFKKVSNHKSAPAVGWLHTVPVAIKKKTPHMKRREKGDW